MRGKEHGERRGPRKLGNELGNGLDGLARSLETDAAGALQVLAAHVVGVLGQAALAGNAVDKEDGAGALGGLLGGGELARKLLEHERPEERKLGGLALPDQAVARKVEPLGKRRVVGAVQVAGHGLEELRLRDGVVLVEVGGQLLVDEAAEPRVQG